MSTLASYFAYMDHRLTSVFFLSRNVDDCVSRFTY